MSTRSTNRGDGGGRRRRRRRRWDRRGQLLGSISGASPALCRAARVAGLTAPGDGSAGQWLQDLWAAHKLSHEQYLAYSDQFGPGHTHRRRDALDALRDERAASVESHVAKELSLLREAKLFKEVRHFDVVETFVHQFLEGPRFRRPMLAVVGGTNLGKSMLAAQILERIA